MTAYADLFDNHVFNINRAAPLGSDDRGYYHLASYNVEGHASAGDTIRLFAIVWCDAQPVYPDPPGEAFLSPTGSVHNEFEFTMPFATIVGTGDFEFRSPVVVSGLFDLGTDLGTGMNTPGWVTGEHLIRIGALIQHDGSSGRSWVDFDPTAAMPAPVPVRIWNVDVNGNWSVAANWTNGQPNGTGVNASFLGVITAPRTVNVDAAKTVGNLTFDNANSYTIGGTGTLTIDGGGEAMIQVINGSHTISAPLSIAAGNTVTKSGNGTLTISGPQSHGAGAVLVASAGVTNLNSDGGQNLSVQANANVNFGATQHLGALQVGAGGTATVTTGEPKNVVTNALTIAGGSTPTGKLDVTNNAVIVDFPAAAPNLAATIRDQIIAGRGGTGLGKPWNGQGITSSTAQADVAASPNSRSIGYAVNADLPLGALTTFHGQVVDPSTVLIRYTRTGDANLDGVVNDDDVTVIGTFYAPGVPKPEWAKGDFDYNGFVDDDDVTLLGVFYNPSAAPISAPDATGSVVAPVPEPGSLALVATGCLAALIVVQKNMRR